jgi:hypothetical protein
MFKCQNCNGNTEANQPVNKIIVKHRDRSYFNLIENPFRRQSREVNSEGWEIEKEIRVCATCYTQLTGKEARKTIKREQEVVKEEKPRDDRKFEQKKRPVVEVVNPLKKGNN